MLFRALLLILFLPGVCPAETVVLKDGSQVTGEVVGFSNDSYQVQIGSYVKRVPRAQVLRIENTPASQAQPSAPPAPASGPGSGAPRQKATHEVPPESDAWKHPWIQGSVDPLMNFYKKPGIQKMVESVQKAGPALLGNSNLDERQIIELLGGRQAVDEALRQMEQVPGLDRMVRELHSPAGRAQAMNALKGLEQALPGGGKLEGLDRIPGLLEQIDRPLPSPDRP